MEHKSSGLFQLVAQGDDLNLQRLLLQAKEERNVATLAHGNTVLHEAAWNGFSRCVQVLCNVYPKDLDENLNKEQLSWKRNHFINRVNFCGFSALHLAAQNGHNQTLRELLYAGCSTSIKNDYGDTPLHTACRYGHAGVVRILISANSDVNSFNLNHDTPLHITCAMGRRKLTKLLLEAEAAQFQNLHNETPGDIATRKKLQEITEILTKHNKKLKKTKIQEASSNINSPDSGQLFHSSKLKYKNNSPYGCHFYPEMRRFPSPDIETLPKEPLEKGEQYFLDLSGKICKGPIGHERKCCCAMLNKNEKCMNFQILDKENANLDVKVNALANKFERTRQRLSKPRKDKEQKSDPLYPLLRTVGDKNKRIHMKQWLHKVYPEIGSISDCQPRKKSEEVAVDFNGDSIQQDPFSEFEQTHVFDNNGNNDQTQSTQAEGAIKNYSEDEYDDCSIDSTNENRFYDEYLAQNFQRQQVWKSTCLNDSVASASICSNSNIEHEMERITKSLLMISTNPDVIRDHIHHSAKRSTNKTKRAFTKSTVLASGDLYVNTFFSNSQAVIGHNSNKSPSLNGNQSIDHEKLKFDNRNAWNQAARSRNPLPLDIDELEKPTENTAHSQETLNAFSNLNDNDFLVIEKLLKESTDNFNLSLQLMKKESRAVLPCKADEQSTNISSSSTLV